MAVDDTDQEVYRRLLDMSEADLSLPSKDESHHTVNNTDVDIERGLISNSSDPCGGTDEDEDEDQHDKETIATEETVIKEAEPAKSAPDETSDPLQDESSESSPTVTSAIPQCPSAPSDPAPTPKWSLGPRPETLRNTFSVSPVAPNEGSNLGGSGSILGNAASPSSSAAINGVGSSGDGRRGQSPGRPLQRTLSGAEDFEEMERQGRGGSFIPGRAWNESRRRMHSSKRSYRRLVFKNGECNISHVNIKKRKRRFLADIFTTLVDVKWRYTLLLFICAFIKTWVLFALVWWLIGFAHEDFAPNRPENWRPCVKHVTGFTTALLFSIETQHTIGYGHRVVTEECPEAVFMVMMQSCLGVIIQALMTGLVFAKLSRPKKRAETLMFSKNAVICKRDGVMTLLFRVGDMRKSHIIEAHIRGILIKKRITREGEVLPMEQYDVDFGFDEGRDRLFLVWPVIIEHKIDCDSPFWEISAMDLQREQFELIVILEGIVESTGMTTQARSSYLPGEILWGNRFEKLITYQKNNGEYQLDYEKFHSTRKIENFPQCSAKDLAEIGEENLSAKGLIQDDDISLASKSYTNTVNSNVMTFLRRNGSVPSAVAQLRQRSVALPEGQTSRFGSFVGSRDQIFGGVGSQLNMRQPSQQQQQQHQNQQSFPIV